MPEAKRRWIGLFAAALACSAPLAAMPDAAQGAFARAKAALRNGDGIAAEAELKRAAGAGASRREIAAAMGETQLILGNTGSAREWLGSGEFAKGDEAYGWRMRGLLERREGHLAAAGRAYDLALVHSPDDPRLWVDIGRLRYVGGEHLLALDAAERALTYGPADPAALEFKAQLVRDSAGWEAALPFYARALEASPGDLAVSGGYAASLGEAGRTREMLEVSRQILAQAPKHPLPWFLQAVVAARAGNVGLARAMMNRVGDGIKQTPAGLLLTGILELEAGNPEVAIGPLAQLVRMQSANQRAQMLLARAYGAAGANDVLLERYLTRGRRADAPAYLLTLLGRALEERGDRIAAAEFLDRAAAAAPLPVAGIIPNASNRIAMLDASGTAEQVRLAFARNDVTGAGRSADSFLAVRPGSVEALGLGGDTRMILGDYPAAIDRYLLAARVRFPEHLLMRLNEAYARASRAGEGQSITSRYLLAYPRSLLATRMAADYALHSRDWERTRLLLEANRARGMNRDVGMLANLALVQVRGGNRRSALKTAEQAWRLQPANAAVAQAFALALAQPDGDPILAGQMAWSAKALGGDPKLGAEIDKLIGASR
jgi:tetratricopeptide (TPR) repeat protein